MTTRLCPRALLLCSAAIFTTHAAQAQQVTALDPITVMLCLIFWGLVWGIPGMLLAAPLTAALKIIFEGIEVLQPCAKLLEGKIEDLFTTWGDRDMQAAPVQTRNDRGMYNMKKGKMQTD